MLWFLEESEQEGMPITGPDRRFMSLISYLGGSYNVYANQPIIKDEWLSPGCFSLTREYKQERLEAQALLLLTQKENFVLHKLFNLFK